MSSAKSEAGDFSVRRGHLIAFVMLTLDFWSSMGRRRKL